MKDPSLSVLYDNFTALVCCLEVNLLPHEEKVTDMPTKLKALLSYWRAKLGSQATLDVLVSHFANVGMVSIAGE